MLKVTAAVQAARDQWVWRGDRRPDFAESTAEGEESVWDYPRPPAVEEVPGELRVEAAGVELAITTRGCRVLETAGAPTYYFPPEDVNTDLLEPLPGGSLCEWKGLAESFRCGAIEPAAWRYTETFPEYVSLRGWYAFYPGELACFVRGERASPQPGGYYGGWVTAAIRGTIKGAPGSGHW